MIYRAIVFIRLFLYLNRVWHYKTIRSNWGVSIWGSWNPWRIVCSSLHTSSLLGIVLLSFIYYEYTNFFNCVFLTFGQVLLSREEWGWRALVWVRLGLIQLQIYQFLRKCIVNIFWVYLGLIHCLIQFLRLSVKLSNSDSNQIRAVRLGLILLSV